MSNPSATRLCPHWKQLDYRSRLCRGDSIVYRMAVPLRKHLPSVRESPKTKNFFGLVQIYRSLFSCHQSDTLKETLSWYFQTIRERSRMCSCPQCEKSAKTDEHPRFRWFFKYELWHTVCVTRRTSRSRLCSRRQRCRWSWHDRTYYLSRLPLQFSMKYMQ